METTQLWIEFKATEAKQLEATEAEDYELAEQLSVTLEGIQQKIHNTERQVSKGQRPCGLVCGI